MTADLQSAKQVVKSYQQTLDRCADGDVARALQACWSENHSWRGMHPFYEQTGAQAVAKVFWLPLRRALSALQRREDVFMAGYNDVDKAQSVWVVSMGHLAGLFDGDFLHIPATKKMAFLRYAEFCRVEDQTITESAFFCDLISLMHQAGHFPLPPQTGADVIHPGPITHDGIMIEPQDPQLTSTTIGIVNEMISDLGLLNNSGNDRCPPETLAKTWHENMIWYGPAGIGTTYTIPRYQQQHQYPFRTQLKDKKFNGHVARIAEGNYAGFFGWSNLTNTPTGGFLGLPGNEIAADMRVVDIYRRENDKLVENWVFIDLLHYLHMQGLDVLRRLKELRDID
ncbi:MAG: ester cyclase [Pseudomonadota bacterium]